MTTTVTITPAVVGAGTSRQRYVNLSSSTSVILTYGIGQAEILYPGAGLGAETRTWTVLGLVGPVTAYTGAGTATLDVIDIATDRGLPGYGGISADDLDSSVSTGTGSALAAESATYNPDGTVATTTVAGVVTTFAYDGAGNVLTEARLGKTKTYTYDGTGNFASASVA